MNKVVHFNLSRPLIVKFQDDQTVTFDMNPIIQKKGVFSKLINDNEFKNVKIGRRGRSLEWSNGLDLCADSIWTKTTGKSIF